MSADLTAAKRYAARTHNSVMGWLAPEIGSTLITLAAHQERLGIVGSVCEIGVYHGKLFVLLCLLMQAQEHALGIDLFDTDAANIYGTDIEKRLRANLKCHGIEASRVQLLAGNSRDLDAKCVRDRVAGVRIFSVDGGHSAEETAHDLSIAAQSVVDGGIV